MNHSIFELLWEILSWVIVGDKEIGDIYAV